MSEAVVVLLDARKLGDGGIGIYIENLVDGLLALRRENAAEIELRLLVNPGFESDLRLDAVRRWQGEVSFHLEKAQKYSAQEYLRLSHTQRELLAEVDLFHSPHYTLPYRLGVPSVVTIHDAIHITHAEHLGQRVIGKRLIHSAMRRASSIITVSKHSASVLRSLFPRVSTPVQVVPNALPLDVSIESTRDAAGYVSARGVDPRYCVFLGSERAHKGFEELLTAWTLLDQAAPDLVLAGDRYSKKSRARVEELGLSNKVHFVGALSRRELLGLLRGAEALCMPSREEGFGLPALEAMASGVSVVCTPNPALREVAGEAAWFAQSFHAKALADAVEQCLSQREEKQGRIELGKERARNFLISAQARATVEVYQTVLGRKILQTTASAPGGETRVRQG